MNPAFPIAILYVGNLYTSASKIFIRSTLNAWNLGMGLVTMLDDYNENYFDEDIFFTEKLMKRSFCQF